MQRRLLSLVLAAVLGASSIVADEVGDSRRLQQEALAAYKDKKPDVFLKKIRAASDLRPQHPTLLVQLAVALAANGQHRDALGVLDRVASMGFVYTLDDAELQPVRALPAFARTAKRFEANDRRGQTGVGDRSPRPDPGRNGLRRSSAPLAHQQRSHGSDSGRDRQW